MSEDKRSAVNVFVTLSGYLVTVALGMLAVEGAFLTYVLGDRQPGILFFVMGVGAVLLLVASVVAGGKGISQSAEAGFEGNWSLIGSSGLFNMQAKLCLLGLVLFAGSAFFAGGRRDAATDRRLWELQVQTNALADSLQTRSGATDARLRALGLRLDSVEGARRRR